MGGFAAIVDVHMATGSQHEIAAEVPGIVAAIVLIAAVIAGLASIFSRRRRRTGLPIVGRIVAGLVALYAVGRGIAEFWALNYSDPASYAHSWGGSSLAGVFAVHSGPGFVIVIVASWWPVLRGRGTVRMHWPRRTQLTGQRADLLALAGAAVKRVRQSSAWAPTWLPGSAGTYGRPGLAEPDKRGPRLLPPWPLAEPRRARRGADWVPLRAASYW